MQGEEITEYVLRDLRVVECIEQLRKEPWRRPEWLHDDYTPSTDKHSADTGNAPRCYLTGKELDERTGIIFYDNRPYENEVLDGLGGSGFAAFVRAHPSLACSTPSHVLAVYTWCLAVVTFFGFTMYELICSVKPDKWETVLGGIFFCGLLGFLLYDGLAMKVILGDGKLWVGSWRGQEAHLDSITSIGRRRWVGIFPVISIKTLGGEMTWPYKEDRSKDIEKAIEVAIKLRERIKEAAEKAKLV